jgi:hypothetical protein
VYVFKIFLFILILSVHHKDITKEQKQKKEATKVKKAQERENRATKKKRVQPPKDEKWEEFCRKNSVPPNIKYV